MEGGNVVSDGATTKAGSKHGTPNKRWRPDFDNLLIPVLVDQVRKGLKCDKSFKRAAFAHAASVVNAKCHTDFTSKNVENHYRTLKARYVEIKKARDLSGAGWDDEHKMITLDPIVAATYTEAHPSAKSFINRPIENYEGLRIICGEDYATGSYAASLFSDFGDAAENEDANNDNGQSAPINHVSDEEGDGNSTPPIPNVSATSSTIRSQRNNKGANNPSIVSDLLLAINEMTSAIRNPTHWTETLYSRVMSVDGFSSAELVEVFEYLQTRENEARGFMVRSTELRQDWIRRFLSRML